MAIIKNFSLCVALLSSFNLFTMEHELLAATGAIVFRSTKSGEVIEDSILGKVWDKIDRDYVKVGNYVMNSHGYLRSLVGSLLSWGKAYYITPKKAKSDLYKIEGDISLETDDKKFGKSILKELVTGHWYVQYLMQVLEHENVCKLENVTGVDIDVLQNNTHEEIAQEIAFSRAYKKFFNDNLGMKKLIDIIPKVVSDIHFTVLYHPYGDVTSLAISSDGKYLQAIDANNSSSIWNVQTGYMVDGPISVDRWNHGKSYADDSQQKRSLFGNYAYESVERYRVVDINDNYCAMISDAYINIEAEFFPEEAANNPKAIILFARPQETSYLCQKAFYNSYMNKTQMQALRNSNARKSIEGFPRKNLKRIIDNHMKQFAVCDRILDGK